MMAGEIEHEDVHDRVQDADSHLRFLVNMLKNNFFDLQQLRNHFKHNFSIQITIPPTDRPDQIQIEHALRLDRTPLSRIKALYRAQTQHTEHLPRKFSFPSTHLIIKIESLNRNHFSDPRRLILQDFFEGQLRGDLRLEDLDKMVIKPGFVVNRI